VIARGMMKAFNQALPAAPMTTPELVEALNLNGLTASGQTVTPENARNVATAYRCINILCNDFAKLPEQVYLSPASGQIERMRPSARTQNAAYLLERSPNRWMTPFKFKRLRMRWLLNYGASYVWQPRLQPGRRRELFILPANITSPMFDAAGNLWYEVRWPGQKPEMLPDVEVQALVINSDDGITGKSVIAHARESLGRRMGAGETKGTFYKHGLNVGGLIWMNGDLNEDARAKAREKFGAQMGGSANAYSLAVMDNKVAKFEQINMRPMDVAFLQSIEQDDLEIANFFEMPLYKLNMGKQTYNSNEQANLDYLNTTLDPYLIQAEEVDAQRLLTEDEQEYTYIRFNRDALLRTDSKTRTETLEKRILSGQLTLNQALQIEDQPAFRGGDIRFIPANMATITPDGQVKPISSKEGDANAK
jgi:HK97 family phage portal protein